MAAKQQVQNYFNFVAGLNTESNPLTAPDNTCLAMENMDLLVDGAVRKRASLEDEAAALPAAVLDSTSIKCIDWTNAGKSGRDLVGFVADGVLHFTIKNTEADILSTAISELNILISDNVKDYLVVDAGLIVLLTTTGAAVLITVTSDLVTLTKRSLNFKERLTGLVEPTVKQRVRYPLSGTGRALAGSRAGVQNWSTNLRRIGWTSRSLIDSTGIVGVTSISQLTVNLWDLNLYDAPVGTAVGTAINLYIITSPTNPIEDAGVLAFSGNIQSVISTADERYRVAFSGLSSARTVTLSAEIDAGRVVAHVLTPTATANGSFVPSIYDSPVYLTADNGIISPTLYKSTAANTSIANSGRELTAVPNINWSCLAFSNQRIFIARERTLYFSGILSTAGSAEPDSILTSVAAIERLHQLNDPTHRHFFELLPDDGGRAVISDCGAIKSMISHGNGILVFCTRGVWYIGGTSGEHFSALGYTIKKVNSVPIYSEVGGIDPVEALPQGIIYTTRDGIELLTTDDGINYTSNSITKSTIHSEYGRIPLAYRANTALLFDSVEQELIVAHKGIQGTITNLLVFDTRLKAWYKLTVDSRVGLRKMFTTHQYSSDGRTLSSSIRYLRNEATTDIIHCARFSGLPNLKDVGVYEYSAFLETNAQIYADGMRNKQLQWFETFMQETENSLGIPSSATCQVKWEWASDPESGKISSPFPIYKLDKYLKANGAGSLVNVTSQVIATRHKVNGTGKSLSLRFEAVPGNSMHLLGWSVVITGNSTV